MNMSSYTSQPLAPTELYVTMANRIQHHPPRPPPPWSSQRGNGHQVTGKQQQPQQGQSLNKELPPQPRPVHLKIETRGLQADAPVVISFGNRNLPLHASNTSPPRPQSRSPKHGQSSGSPST